MRVASSDRLQGDLLRLVHRGCGPRDFARAASRILDRAIPFDGLCILTMDPATRLATSAYVENGLRAAEAARIAEIEYSEPDFNQFGTLARSGRLAASLEEATGGKLDRSLRHRELRAPHDMGDELRALLVTGEATWGSLTLGRLADRGPFTHAEVELVMSVSAHLAEGLRRAILLTSLPSAPDEEGAAGLVLVAPDSSIVRADSAATGWLAELGTDGLDTPLPAVVTTAASRARSIATGRDASGAAARARVRTESGTWLTVRGSLLGDEDDGLTAVTLEPARPHELAPLVADAYGLTPRERAVTQLVARGLTTEAIGRRLYLSPWTVQDHLKSIFEKVDVSSRGELTARIYFEHYAPRLSER